MLFFSQGGRTEHLTVETHLTMLNLIVQASMPFWKKKIDNAVITLSKHFFKLEDEVWVFSFAFNMANIPHIFSYNILCFCL